MVRSKPLATRIVRLSAEPLTLQLLEPFTIATGSSSDARNVLLRLELEDGTIGWGEAAPYPPSGGESQETTLAAIAGMRALVEGADAAAWRTLAARLVASFEHQEAARAGVEMAVLDAFTRAAGVPLFQFCGGAQTQVVTDISIPIEAPEHMAALARGYAERGAATLKLKVGTKVAEDVERVLAVVASAPRCAIMLDGNQGCSPAGALELIRALAARDVRPILFEQPVHRHDLEGLRFVTERAGLPVAADESVHTAADALRVARIGAANVINIKLMKSGVVESLDIAAICRAARIDLMVGAMMESRLGAAASAHVVAGLGGFRYIDLDTPLLLAEDPFTGGFQREGFTYRLDPSASGLGVRPRDQTPA